MYSLLCEYSNLEYARIYVIYRVTQGGMRYSYSYGCVQEYVNIYSTSRVKWSHLYPYVYVSMCL